MHYGSTVCQFANGEILGSIRSWVAALLSAFYTDVYYRQPFPEIHVMARLPMRLGWLSAEGAGYPSPRKTLMQICSGRESSRLINLTGTPVSKLLDCAALE